MRALEYHINGKRACVAGINGAGVLATHVDIVRGSVRSPEQHAPEDIHIHVGGLNSHTRTHLVWLHRSLRVGDSVPIDVVETKRVNRPKKAKSESVKSRMRREQEYVAKKAAEWGWIIHKPKASGKGARLAK